MIKKFKLIVYSLFLKFIFNSIFVTCRWKIVGLDSFNEALKKNRPILLCLWHEHLVCVSRYFKKTTLNLYAVSSTHFDSEILAKILFSWKIKLIRGSSTHGWSSVLKQMIVLFKKASTLVALTNDGPQGPARIAKEGSLSVAKKYNAQIISIAAKSTKSWRLHSWDKTLLPKPFSTIYIKFSKVYPDGQEVNANQITKFITSNSDDLLS
jgi:lysophospholipid acyltransferase (LPLAT)-like uncharacterized protein